jgi:hypothetical protein
MTRKIYIKLAREVAAHDRAILQCLMAVGLGGFLMLLIASQMLENGHAILNFPSKLWFSISAVLGALYMITQWFNPERDMVDISSKESFLVMLINFILFIAVYAWFM